MFDFLKDMLVYFKRHKKYWLFPIITFLLLFGAMLVFVEGSVVAPFIYTLF